jgi:peptidyl-prolyl cis-trans isomerase SurA
MSLFSILGDVPTDAPVAKRWARGLRPRPSGIEIQRMIVAEPCIRRFRRLLPVFLCAALALAAIPTQGVGQSAPVVLDRVVAVVNNRAILTSDVKEEMLLSVLEPRDAERDNETPQAALQRIISRTLIRQQIREEDATSIEPTSEEVQERLTQIRRQLPVCVRENCSTGDGWKEFLTHHGLTQTRVDSYIRGRMEILRFIELRFRQGIRISQQEIDAYYRDTLEPQYQTGQAPPPLDQVAPRIEEILLQRQVNAMFGGWLDSLRKQGEVEVLDPSLETANDSLQGGTAP